MDPLNEDVFPIKHGDVIPASYVRLPVGRLSHPHVDSTLTWSSRMTVLRWVLGTMWAYKRNSLQELLIIMLSETTSIEFPSVCLFVCLFACLLACFLACWTLRFTFIRFFFYTFIPQLKITDYSSLRIRTALRINEFAYWGVKSASKTMWFVRLNCVEGNSLRKNTYHFWSSPAVSCLSSQN